MYGATRCQRAPLPARAADGAPDIYEDTLPTRLAMLGHERSSGMEPIPLNPRFAPAPGHYLVTDKGVRLRLRLVESSDRAMIFDFVARLAPDGLRCHDRSTGARLDGPTLARLLDRPGRGEHALAFDRDTGA